MANSASALAFHGPSLWRTRSETGLGARTRSHIIAELVRWSV